MRFVRRLLGRREESPRRPEQSYETRNMDEDENLHDFDADEILGAIPWMHFPLGRIPFPGDIDYL